MPAITTIKNRGGTAAAWTAANPVLALRELGLETDTKNIKIGDGVTAWNGLSYVGSGTYAKSPSFRPGVYVPEGWGTYWRAALAAAGTTPAILAGVGDSILRGLYAAPLNTASWMGLLRARLQAQYGDCGSGFQGTVDTSINSPGLVAAYAADFWTLTGTWSAFGNNGRGIVSLSSSDAGTATTTVRGTRVKVSYLTGSGTGTFTWTVDGVSQGTVNTNTGAYGLGVASATVADGTHTVSVTPAASTFICGFSGEKTTGVLVNNYGFQGGRSVQVGGNAASLSNATEPGNVTGGYLDPTPAHLIIYAYGVNDDANTVAVATYLSNVRKYLDKARGQGARNGGVDILLLLPHIGTFDDTNKTWHQYQAGMRSLADAYGAAFIDVGAAIGRNSWAYSNSVGYWGNPNGSGGSSTDVIHPSNTGHTAMYNLINPLLVAAEAA